MALISVFTSNWLQIALKIALTAVILSVLVGLCMLVIVTIRRLLRYKGERSHTIVVRNQGNVPSVFHLIAKSLESHLKFQFLMGQIPLPEITEEIVLPSPMVKHPFAQVKNGQSERAFTQQSKEPIDPGRKNPLQAVQGGSQAAKSVVAKTGAVASILGVIGGLLPGDLGKKLKEQGAAARGMQTKAKDVMDKPQGLQNKLGQMQKDSGKLGIKTPPSLPTSNGQGMSVETSQITSPQQMANGMPVTSKVAAVQTVRFFRTAIVEPGETHNISLEIGSTKRVFPEGSFLYTISSQQVPVEKFGKEISPLLQEGIVHFDPVNKWRYWLPDLLSFLIVVAFLLSIVYSISLLWG